MKARVFSSPLFWGSVGIVALAVWLLAAHVGRVPPGAQGESAPSPSERGIAVQVQAVRMQRVGKALELSGTVKAFRTATVATRVSGRITRLDVEEGDRVVAGQILGQVDTSAVSAQTRQAVAGVGLALATSAESEKALARAQAGLLSAEARARQAEAQLQEAQASQKQAEIDQKRMAFLFKGDSIARADLDRANTALSVARARVASLRASLAQTKAEIGQVRASIEQSRAAHAQSVAGVQVARSNVDVAASDLAYGVLRAPFSGAVTRKLAHLGDMAAPGKTILEIQEVGRLYLEVPTPEESLRYLLPGRTVHVRVDALDRDARATVYQIIPSADPQTRSFTVKLHLPREAGLVPGLYGKIRLDRGVRQALLIPQSALVRRGQLVNVFVVSKEIAGLRLVRVGETYGPQMIEVLSGLSAGEKVVVTPPGELEDGDRVHVSSRDTSSRLTKKINPPLDKKSVGERSPLKINPQLDKKSVGGRSFVVEGRDGRGE